MAAKQTKVHRWIRRSLTAEPPRSKSLIMTVFGDSLLPHVPGVWLGELVALLEPFQINSQLTRTSVFRLAEEGWLQARRDGRRSFYSLTDSGQQRVEHAYQRIYELPSRAWNGSWTIVVLRKSHGSPAARTQLRRELQWEGFGVLGSGIFLHPRVPPLNLSEALRRLRLADDVAVLQARDLDGFAARSAASLASECWDCDRVAMYYNGFLKKFAPVIPLLEGPIQPDAAFILQTLLIHSFRRVVLHDPQLPSALLPKDWPGHAAYDLCRSVYRKTYLLTRAHLAAHLEAGLHRPLTPASAFINRLGGLGETTLVSKGWKL